MHRHQGSKHLTFSWTVGQPAGAPHRERWVSAGSKHSYESNSRTLQCRRSTSLSVHNLFLRVSPVVLPIRLRDLALCGQQKSFTARRVGSKIYPRSIRFIRTAFWHFWRHRLPLQVIEFALVCLFDSHTLPPIPWSRDHSIAVTSTGDPHHRSILVYRAILCVQRSRRPVGLDSPGLR